MKAVNKHSVGLPNRISAGMVLSILALPFICGGASKTKEDIIPVTYFETRTIDGFSIGVTDNRGFTALAPERWLCCTVFTTATNPVPVRMPQQQEYVCQIELLDAHGNVIPKTEMGKKVGTKFTEFAPKSSTIARSRAVLAPAKRKEEQMWLPILFRPNDLFVIEKPGDYTLRIRFQLATYPGQPGRRTPKVIQFPPLDCPLVKQ